MAGLLGLDPQTLAEIKDAMSQLGLAPDPATEKRQALARALISGGGAMLSSPAWQGWQGGLGRGLQTGAQQYGSDMMQQGALRGQNMQQALQLMNVARQNMEIGNANEVGNAIARAYQATPNATLPPGGMAATGPNTAPPAPPSTAPGVSATPPGLGDPYTMLMQRADSMESYAQTNPNLSGINRKAILDQAEKYREQALKFRDENQTAITAIDPVTKQPVLIQPRKYGPAGQLAYQPKPDTQAINAGNRTEFVNMLQPPTAPIAHGVSPDTVYSGGVTMRGQNMTDTRERQLGTWQFDPEAGVQVNKITGQTRPAVNQQGVAIGPKDAQQQVNLARDTVDMANRVLSDIKDIKPNVSVFTTGIGGEVIGKVPGTPAYDMEARLRSVKANLGFQQLSALRAASPTGGALGQVSDIENKLLQAAIADLDKAQSPQQLSKALTRVETHLNKVKGYIAQGLEARSQRLGAPLTAPAQQQPNTIDFSALPK